MRRKISLSGLGLAVGVCLFGGCATVSVANDFDRSVDFSRYKTFGLVGGHMVVNGVQDDANTLVRDRIQNSVLTVLASRGLVQNNDNPDLIVGYQAGARTRTEIEGMGPYMPGVGPYWNAGWWTPGYMDWWTRTYEEGTLVIDMVEASSKRLVWRSYIRGEVRPPITQENLDKAVAKAFKNYPPAPGAPLK